MTVALRMTDARTSRSGHVVAGKYVLRDCIGRGAFSVVYRAHAIRLGRDVALKLLDVQGEHGELAARFRQEASALAALQHCGVVDLVDDGVEEGGSPYIAMELLTGITLRSHLVDYGRLGSRDAVIIVIRLARVLDLLHTRGFVHRDVKPDNVFLETRPDGAAIRLLDLGSARRLATSSDGNRSTRPGIGGPDPRSARTAPGMVLGTPQYMSPEQWTAGVQLDPRSDIYSLGIVLYELLSGVTPFAGPTPSRIAKSHLFFQPPPLSGHVPVSASLAAAVMRALAKEPEDRFDSMGDFACALAEAARDEERRVREESSARSHSSS